MTSQYVIDLQRSGSDVAWGFRIQGGSEYGAGLSIQRVFSGTPADGNLQRGDLVSKVNGNDVTHLTLNQAQELIKLAGNNLSLNIQRDSHSQQDFHVSAQAPSFASTDYHHSPPRHPPNQPAQQFHSNAFPTQPIVTSPVSTLKFQPKPDHEPHFNQHNFQSHSDHPSPQHHDWQPHHEPSSSEPHQQHQQHHHHHHEHEEFHHEEHSGDVDDEHLRPVKEIKSMFNHGSGSRDTAHVVRKGHPVRVAQPRKPQGTTKYQPPSPAIKPAVATHVQSAKHPPVYQQRSSYNPLDFQGVTPKSPIPASRPPGLIQRGAVELKPRGTSLDYQPPSHFKPDQHHQNVSQHQQHQQQQHHQPTITPQGNLDPLTDFYLHGLNAKSELPDFTKSQTTSYAGKILPPRSEVAIKTPTSAPKKKEFHAEQSAVYRILQEEEDARQRGRGGQAAGKGSEEGRRYQIPSGSGGPRLAELLEKDQAQLAPYHEDDQQHPQHQQHQQQHHQQQQYQQQYQQQHQHPQHYQQQQYQQQHQQQQYQQHQHSPTKHTSTAQFLPSPSREQAPRHDYNDYHGNYQQQHHYQNWAPQDAGRRHVAHTGLPETDF